MRELLLERGAEVGELGLAALRKQDVRRLDIAVDDAVPAGVLERPDALEDDLDDLGDGQQTVGSGMGLQRRAGDVLHHEVAAVRLDHRVVDVDDMRVVQLPGERRLGDERLVHHALFLRIGVLVELEHLDRHVAIGEGIAREVHLAGGAAADLLRDRIFADVHGPNLTPWRVQRSA